mmetsp:Transcript_7371/g.19868  ORF Transcript_7371/g.19868 Transcript_7371/m.19868 type:complete len:256 (+) Transcript_7371:287-1054(+)
MHQGRGPQGALCRMIHPVRRWGLRHPRAAVRRPDRGGRGARPSKDPARARRRAGAWRPLPLPRPEVGGVLLGRRAPAGHRVVARVDAAPQVDVGLRGLRRRRAAAGGVEHPVLLSPFGRVGIHHEAVHHQTAWVMRMVLQPRAERCHGLLLRGDVAVPAQSVTHTVRAGRRGVRGGHGPRRLRRGPRRGRVPEELVGQPQHHEACPVLRDAALACGGAAGRSPALRALRGLVLEILACPLLLGERLLVRLPADRA